MFTLVCVFGLALNGGQVGSKEVKRAEFTEKAMAEMHLTEKDLKRKAASLCKKVFGQKADLATVEAGK